MNAPQYIVDDQGNRRAVVLDLETYRALLKTQEDADDVRAFDEGMANLEGDELLSIDELRAELETVWAARAQPIDH